MLYLPLDWIKKVGISLGFREAVCQLLYVHGHHGPHCSATLAGQSSSDAEIVSALVLIQMHSGTPVFHSFMPGVMHPRTGDISVPAARQPVLPNRRRNGPSLGRTHTGRCLWHRWPNTRLGIAVRQVLPELALDRCGNWQRAGLLESCTLLYPDHPAG